jgi:hypothetical protein
MSIPWRCVGCSPFRDGGRDPAAQLAGCDAKTVKRYVVLREAGGGDPLVHAAAARPKLIDGFLPKVEELVDNSKGKIRADKAAASTMDLKRLRSWAAFR